MRKTCRWRFNDASISYYSLKVSFYMQWWILLFLLSCFLSSKSAY